MSAFNAMRTLGWDPKDDPQSVIVQAKRAGVEVDLGDGHVVHVRNDEEAEFLRGTLAVLRSHAAGAAKAAAPAKRTPAKTA